MGTGLRGCNPIGIHRPLTEYPVPLKCEARLNVAMLFRGSEPATPSPEPACRRATAAHRRTGRPDTMRPALLSYACGIPPSDGDQKMSCVFPDSFATPRLILRPIAAADAPAIFAGYAQDPGVVRYLTWRRHQTIVETEAYIAGCLTKPAASARTYVLTERIDGRLLGAFDLRRPESHRFDCGYVLARPFWGRGLMTEALTEIAGWAMRQDGIRRLGAVCDIDNLASARVMEKAGLAREGILRRWLVHPNIGPEPRDCFSYAKCR